MTVSNLNTFDREIKLLTNLELQQFCYQVMPHIPEPFFVKPASSTSKYHPDTSNVNGGLINHTKMAIYIANSRFGMGKYKDLPTDIKDVVIDSLIFHDIAKYGLDGNSKWTEFEHPILAEKILDKVDRSKFSPKANRMVDSIIKNIRSHHGAWNTNFKSEVVLPLPESNTGWFIHDCDFISSFPFLNFNHSRI